MTDRWLFHIKVANKTADEQHAGGLGHAMKCLSLSKEVRSRGGSVQFCVEGPVTVCEFFEERDVAYQISDDPVTVAGDYEPAVIVTDVNYLSRGVMDRYRRIAPVVNLAPRGECKFYADISFNSARIQDHPKPDDATLRRWYTGPEYAILNPEFITLRERIDARELTPDRDGVILQMGGVDQYDLTGQVLEYLDPANLRGKQLTVVAGPFNESIDRLKKLCEPIDEASFHVDPSQYPSLVAGHELGIFGTGISTYEALSVGVPSLNVGITEFHSARGETLEKRGICRYLGQYDSLESEDLNHELSTLLDDSGALSRMRKKGMEIVDRHACRRIVDRVGDEFD